MSRHGNSRRNDNQSSDAQLMGIYLALEIAAAEEDVPRNIPCRTSRLQGRYYIEKVLGNDTRCYENFRMNPHIFHNLCDTLRANCGIRNSRNGMTVEEMVGMFLLVVAHSTRLAVVAERFQHSKETVSRVIKVIAHGIHSLSPTYIRRRNVAVQPKIQSCRKWYPFFQNCIGAIDGTHVSACVPSSVRGAYRYRNNEITQNVLAACSHDMMFTYVVTGWEGSAHDSRILSDAATLELFPAPYGEQYYVVDAGFPNIPGYLAPYKGQRYHRSDYNDDTPPTTEKELFNQRHASVRNVIERCFGVLKNRFAILRTMSNYGPLRQGQITLACFVFTISFG
ncbi:protein ALP1-like isoform X1 [Punica granatum]|uniref:Protein ALP1-like isoform X1 n=1 Tax=Punica granatum TaxID=22663 RepID=A0A6P8D954_PUNGR|nr:protein ALP1-like isoform X1 [Punica granatum]XP_031393174.1 protein ALP1-like isoform X1 [Punica granatum]XP_031393175.1 protein ALP1-like isoform X1 [Punica granatum]